MAHKIQSGDLLLVIDPQKDFMPGGALPVEKADRIIPVINAWINAAVDNSVPIAISRHWHPDNHTSFQCNGGGKPKYCIKNTPGAMFHKDLIIPKNAIIIDKSFMTEKEDYSIFEGATTKDLVQLSDIVAEKKIKRVWIIGLTLDFCVYHSAISACMLKLDVHVVYPGCRGTSKTFCETVLEHMKKLDVVLEYDPTP